MTKKTDYLTSAEAGKILGISARAVSNLTTDGKLKVLARGKRARFLFDPEEVKALAKERSKVPDEVTSPQRSQPTKGEIRDRAEQNFATQLLDRFGTGVMAETYQPVVRWAAGTAPPKSPGTPVLFLSDIHYGENVDPIQVLGSNEFSPEICARRLKHVFEMAVTLLKTHLAAPQYDGIVLILGGDMINGALHEDSAMSDTGTPLMQALGIARLIADGVAFLASEFPRVTIYCVPGNHGRLTRRSWSKFHAQTNLDWLSYILVQDYCRDLANVEVNAPPVRDLMFEIANRKYRLTHGDTFRGGDGIIGPLGPVTRGDVRKRFAAAQMPSSVNASYQTLLCGHFHTLMMLPRLIMNGSVKGFDEYALSINVPFEPPQQALWTVHPRWGHTWYAPVLCDPEHL